MSALRGVCIVTGDESGPRVIIAQGDDCLQFRVLAQDTTEYEVLASVRLRPLRECVSIGWISGLETRPANRRKGLGYALIRAIEAHARSHGLGLLVATIWQENEASRGLFEKCGFQNGFEWYSPHTDRMVCLYRKNLERR